MIDKFLKKLYINKKVSIWGAGYLGYTTALKLQMHGFIPVVYNQSVSEKKINKGSVYPTKDQKSLWTSEWSVPTLDLSKSIVTSNIDEMFQTNVHILSIPLLDNLTYSESLIQTINENLNTNESLLFLFQSSEVPGTIDGNVIRKMKTHKNISFASILRSDWLVEDFFTDKKRRAIGANDDISYSLTKTFLNIFNIESFRVDSIRLAEIYENAKKSIQYSQSAFLSQLAMSYPKDNIGNIAKYLSTEVEHNQALLGMGRVDYKLSSANDNLLSGALIPKNMTILMDAQRTNLSLYMYYSDILKRKNFHSVLIMGVSSKRNQRDMRLSLSVMLINYLFSIGMAVYIYDPLFSEKEIMDIDDRIIVDNMSVKVDAVVCMTGHDDFQSLTQHQVNKNSLYNSKIIIDYFGVLRNLQFSNSTIYHSSGDGVLY